MEVLAIFLTLASALGAYQFFLWLYRRRPNILIGILPHYEILTEGRDLTEFGRYCVAAEFLFDVDYFAAPYNVNNPIQLTQLTIDPKRDRKILRKPDGTCSIPVIVQNIGRGFSKDLFYVISFYENTASSTIKSSGMITVEGIHMERLDQCYLYSSKRPKDDLGDTHIIVSDDGVRTVYDDIGLLADYVYFESFLEPKAFVLNIIDIRASKELSEFLMLFNVFSLQNEKLMISKCQRCSLVDEKGAVPQKNMESS